MRRGGRQRWQFDGEGYQGAAPKAGSQHPGFHGGPSDTSLLTRYQDHVACHLWFGEERGPKTTLKVAAHGSKLIGWVSHSLPKVINDWLVGSGLSSLQHTSLSIVDTDILYAFVERWNPETSSFRMPFGEMTITLDDVSYLLHIPIRGELVDPDYVFTGYDAITLAVKLFGVLLSDALTIDHSSVL
ncbi:protein MAIN-LIKE 1-like [Vicia villosa]|uniref:protein MAIN-LIKE 1-like n=1 Tax=Vicia villosa TaxID=3911 RepID=UPI00273BB75F|nr:protein MAIN-LIKE 1-like [Vicia villosa]